MTKRAVITLDVEEFDVPLEYGIAVDEEEQFQIGAQGFTRVLDVLDALALPCTLFCTAKFAERFPELIQRASQRHEIASHGYSHSQFEESDLAKSRAILQNISQQEIIGFRRPRMQDTSLTAIAQAGYLYDSSLNPTWIPGRYCKLNQPRLPFKTPQGIWEIPVSVSPLVRFPLFWLSMKHLPSLPFRALTNWTLNHDGHVNWYVHPWEFSDIEKFKLPKLISQPCGSVLLERFSSHLQWLQSQAQCITFHKLIQTL